MQEVLGLTKIYNLQKFIYLFPLLESPFIHNNELKLDDSSSRVGVQVWWHMEMRLGIGEGCNC
jgi:hypothetical protein